MYKLLIAEDVKTVRETLVRSIPWQELGVTVVGAVQNGEEALIRLEDEEPDLLLTDIGMPKMNGLELIELAQARKPDIRCIILSGLNEFEHARQAIKLQVLDYVLKPIDPGEIEKVVARAIRTLSKEREERRELDQAGQVSKDKLPHLSEMLLPGELTGNLKKKKLVEQAIQYMKEQYTRRELSLSDVAAAVGLSEKYMNLLVKDVTGATINHLIIGLRMEEAARLLKNPMNRIYEICERIGYTDQDHFRESFKKQYGLTPTEYRNQHL
ncbi:response regulator transcription factor [Cohnella lupini]|uniref:Two-component system response regulator YesN n=1 Tax=Cohnella lupini TaxID=1294267 RepID=A0A3D9ISS6_9BACL|nr:response regulator [Cohnella lupini]RED64843.1 two-component system response regulator YesN [Cohnella lupini]